MKEFLNSICKFAINLPLPCNYTQITQYLKSFKLFPRVGIKSGEQFSAGSLWPIYIRITSLCNYRKCDLTSLVSKYSSVSLVIRTYLLQWQVVWLKLWRKKGLGGEMIRWLETCTCCWHIFDAIQSINLWSVPDRHCWLAFCTCHYVIELRKESVRVAYLEFHNLVGGDRYMCRLGWHGKRENYHGNNRVHKMFESIFVVLLSAMKLTGFRFENFRRLQWFLVITF